MMDDQRQVITLLFLQRFWPFSHSTNPVMISATVIINSANWHKIRCKLLIYANFSGVFSHLFLFFWGRAKGLEEMCATAKIISTNFRTFWGRCVPSANVWFLLLWLLYCSQQLFQGIRLLCLRVCVVCCVRRDVAVIIAVLFLLEQEKKSRLKDFSSFFFFSSPGKSTMEKQAVKIKISSRCAALVDWCHRRKKLFWNLCESQNKQTHSIWMWKGKGNLITIDIIAQGNLMTHCYVVSIFKWDGWECVCWLYFSGACRLKRR